jgi:hypothetical protein
LFHFVRSVPNQVIVRIGQLKCSSANTKINWDYSGIQHLMHEISKKRSIKCIFCIKLKTDNYELLSKSSIKTERMRILGEDNCELLSKYP